MAALSYLIENKKARKYIYRVGAALVVALVGFGVLDEGTAGTITALLGTVLAVGYAGLADANVPADEPKDPLEGTHELD